MLSWQSLASKLEWHPDRFFPLIPIFVGSFGIEASRVWICNDVKVVAPRQLLLLILQNAGAVDRYLERWSRLYADCGAAQLLISYLFILFWDVNNKGSGATGCSWQIPVLLCDLKVISIVNNASATFVRGLRDFLLRNEGRTRAVGFGINIYANILHHASFQLKTWTRCIEQTWLFDTGAHLFLQVFLQPIGSNNA